MNEALRRLIANDGIPVLVEAMKRTVLTITESELRKLLKLPAKCSVRGVHWNLLRDRLEISVIESGLESRYAANEGDVCVVTRIQAHDDRSESE